MNQFICGLRPEWVECHPNLDLLSAQISSATLRIAHFKRGTRNLPPNSWSMGRCVNWTDVDDATNDRYLICLHSWGIYWYVKYHLGLNSDDSISSSNMAMENPPFTHQLPIIYPSSHCHDVSHDVPMENMEMPNSGGILTYFNHGHSIKLSTHPEGRWKMADGPNVSWSHIIQWQKQHTKKKSIPLLMFNASSSLPSGKLT